MNSPFTSIRSEAVVSYTVRIWMAGDYNEARRIVRRFCSNRGACFAVQQADYIYTGGEEAGICVTLIHYPRFPSTPTALYEKAHDLASLLMDELGQTSFTIDAPDETRWFTRRRDE